MNRGIVFTGAVPLDVDWLYPQRSAMTGLAGLSQAVLGVNTVIDGLLVTPVQPTALAVYVRPGSIYSQAALDAQDYGSMIADIQHQIQKQGLQLDPLRVPIQPPGTPGYSQVFLLQAAFQEQDGGTQVLPYYNSANPAQAWSGPGNSGTQQYTQRNGAVVVQVKASAPAPTGSTARPTPDPGWVGLAWVTVANGQAVILDQHIVQYPGIHRILQTLPQLGRVAGGAITRVSSSATVVLTADQAGLVLVDCGAFDGPVTIQLPPANSVPGVPMRFMFVGRYVTPRVRRVLTYARIVGAPGDTMEREFYYCGPMDTAEVVSDGSSSWLWVRGHDGTTIVAYAAGDQSIPSGVETAINLQPPGAEIASGGWWSAAAPSRLTSTAYARYSLNAGVCFVNNAAGVRWVYISYNGGIGNFQLPFATQSSSTSGSATIMRLQSPPLGLFDGDYVQLIVRQDSGSPLTVEGFRSGMSIKMESP